MRYAAPLAIVATAVAAGLTIVAVRTLGPAAEAHPVTRVVATQIGWVGYLSLSIVLVALGLRVLAILPFAEWGVRIVALAKAVDALRDAWLVAHHPTVNVGTIGDARPAFLAFAAAATIGLLIVRGWPTPRPPVEPDVEV